MTKSKLCLYSAGAALLSPFFAGAALADIAANEGLTEIVVTAAAREQQVKDAPASISVITTEDLEKTPYREVTDALLEIPGVTVVAGEGNSRDISIRGMAAQYTLILVDGKRLNARESRTNGGNISEGGLLPPVETIQRIEVVRGPMSSLYGSDAMGGVINIITKRVADVWGGSVRVNGTRQLEEGFGDYYDANFYVSGPLVKDVLGLQISGSGNRRDEDDYVNATPERRDDSLAAKLGWTLNPDHTLLFEVGRYNQKVWTTAGKSVATSATAPRGTESYQSERRTTYSLTHTGDWGFATSDSYVLQEDAIGTNNAKSIKNTNAQTAFLFPLGAHTASIGAFYRKEKMKDLTSNGLSDRTGTERKQWAVFAEDEWRLTDSFALTGGLRLDNDEEYGDHLTPRLYGVWNFSPAWTLKGGYSQGFRAPNLRQTLSDWGQNSRGGTIYGNPDLEAETSETYEAGLYFGQPRRLQASATVYKTKFKDKITRVTCVSAGAWCVDQPLSSIGRPPTTYVNIDEAEITGFEFTLDAPLSRAWSLRASATLTDSEQLTGDNKGAALNDTPEQQASLSLNWRPGRKFNAYARAIYRGEEAVTEAQISGNSTVAPSVTTVDIGGAYRVNRSVTFYGGVQNLFNTEVTYEEHGYYYDGARLWLGMKSSF